jgi:hypothetical protein
MQERMPTREVFQSSNLSLELKIKRRNLSMTSQLTPFTRQVTGPFDKIARWKSLSV